MGKKEGEGTNLPNQRPQEPKGKEVRGYMHSMCMFFLFFFFLFGIYILLRLVLLIPSLPTSRITRVERVRHNTKLLLSFSTIDSSRHLVLFVCQRQKKKQNNNNNNNNRKPAKSFSSIV